MFNNDALDDQLIADGCASFSGGQVSDSRPSILDPGAAALLKNIDLQPNGDATTRRGVSRLGPGKVDSSPTDATYGGGIWIQGMAPFVTPAFTRFLAINKRALWIWNGSAWSIVAGYLAGALNAHIRIPVCIVQGNSSVYFADVFKNIIAWDGTVFTDLGSGGAAQPPFGATSIIWFTNRLIATGMAAEPDTVAFSDILDATTWNTATQQLNVGKGDGEPISGIIGWTDFNVLVLKRNSIWVINVNPSVSVANFEIKPITQRVGVFAWRTAQQVGNDVFVLTDHGVRSILRTIATENKQDIGPALSFPVDDIIRRINPSVRTLCHATVRNDRYILFLPLDSSSYCNYALVYNTLTQSWSGYWTGWNATCTAARIHSDDSVRMVFGDAFGYAREWLDYVYEADEVLTSYQDDTVDITSYLHTRAINFREPQSPKSGLNYEIEYTFNGFSAGDPPEVAKHNEIGAGIGGPDVLTNVIGALTRDAFDLQNIGQFRELQFRVHATAGKLSVKRIAANAFADTIVLQT